MNMQVTDWAAHYKAVRERITNAAPLPPRIRLGRERYEKPIGPIYIRPDAIGVQKIEGRDWIVVRSSKQIARCIIREVADAYNVTPESIVGPSREAKFTLPRHHVVYRLREELKISYPKIGRLLGGRDHTSAINSHRRFKALLDSGEVAL